MFPRIILLIGNYVTKRFWIVISFFYRLYIIILIIKYFIRSMKTGHLSNCSKHSSVIKYTFFYPVLYLVKAKTNSIIFSGNTNSRKSILCFLKKFEKLEMNPFQKWLIQYIIMSPFSDYFFLNSNGFTNCFV